MPFGMFFPVTVNEICQTLAFSAALWGDKIKLRGRHEKTSY
jgi:hypothetical protein